MLGGVWLIYFGFGLLSLAMAPLVDPISRDLGLSYTTMGAILGAWPLVYIVAAAPCGAFVDRVGLKWSLFLAALIITASGGLRVVAVDAVSMFVAVGLFGIGGPLVSIGAPKAIAQWFEGPERGFALGVYITGPFLGHILALVLTNSVLMPLLDGNWRQVLLIYSGLILAAGIAWFLLGSHPINRVVEQAGRRRETIAGQLAVFAALLRLPSIQVILAMSIGAFFLHHALANWLPEMLRTGGMAPDEAGIWSALPTAVGIVGALLIPRLATSQRRFAILIALSLCIGAGSVLLLATGVPALVVAMVLQGHRPRHADRGPDPGPDGDARRRPAQHRGGGRPLLLGGRDRRRAGAARDRRDVGPDRRLRCGPMAPRRSQPRSRRAALSPPGHRAARRGCRLAPLSLTAAGLRPAPARARRRSGGPRSRPVARPSRTDALRRFTPPRRPPGGAAGATCGTRRPS